MNSHWYSIFPAESSTSKIRLLPLSFAAAKRLGSTTAPLDRVTVMTDFGLSLMSETTACVSMAAGAVETVSVLPLPEDTVPPPLGREGGSGITVSNSAVMVTFCAGITKVLPLIATPLTFREPSFRR